MFNPNSYRTCEDFREILRILQKSSSSQENFLWQSDSFSKNVVKIHQFEIDFVARGVVMYFDGEPANVNSELPIFVKLEYRETVFKILDFKVSGNVVTFSIPKDLKTLELRTHSRVQITEQSNKYASLKPSLQSIGRDTNSEMQMRVIDVSERGVGLLVSEHSRSFLKNNRILWLTRLQDQTLEYPILAEVVYISAEADKGMKRKQKDLRVGLKLSGPLSADSISTFVS